MTSFLIAKSVRVLFPESPAADLGPLTEENPIEHYQINQCKMRLCHGMKTFEHLCQFLDPT